MVLMLHGAFWFAGIFYNVVCQAHCGFFAKCFLLFLWSTFEMYKAFMRILSMSYL